MCGIVGYQSELHSTFDAKAVVNSMKDSIRYRGPDGEGDYFHGNTAFGHVRLAIIDIKHGGQPMTSKDGRYTICYNGEIYNYLEIRQHLTAQGYSLSTFSDTEVILYAYIAYGRKFLHYLNGMFAFAIYDQQEQSIFIARDHLGIKPLYYWISDGEFVFASEIKALFHYPSIEAEIDLEGIYQYLTFQMTLGETTMFRNIRELEPATYLVVRDGKIQEKHNYWQIQYSINTDRKANEFADELLVLLENALSIQVRSDVPVGAYLSGGLDSSTVSVLAAKNYFGQLKTFAGGFKEDEVYDETNYARIVADYINSDLYEIFPTSSDFLDVFEKLIYHMDYPGAGPGLFPQYMVSKLASEHVKVVLGGQGGDEIFGGYARYAVAYLEQCLKGAIFESQEEGQHVVTLPSIIPNLPMLRQYVPMIRGQFAKGLFESMDRRYFRLVDRSPNLHHLYNADFLMNRSEESIFSRFSDIFNYPESPSYFNKMTYFDTKTLLPTLLQIEDRVSMAVSLESRVPLLDRRIVELAASIPPTMKFAGGKTKAVLLRSVKNILPKAIIDRKDKMGFPVPINEWLAGSLRDYFLDIFSSSSAKNRGIFKVGEIMDRIEGSGKFNRDLWGVLNLEIWFQKFIDR